MVLMDLLNTIPGQYFFSTAIVSHHLKYVFEAYSRMLDSPLSLKYMNEEEPHGWLCKTAASTIDWN